LAILDRMMAAPAVENVATSGSPGPKRNVHAGAAAAERPGVVEKPSARESLPKDSLDEAAELFKSIFKGDIVP
jgi:hypothetical protein